MCGLSRPYRESVATGATSFLKARHSSRRPSPVARRPSPVDQQAVDIVLDTGGRRGLFQATLTMGSSVGLVNSLWIGAGAAFVAADADAGAPVAVLVGVMCGALLIVAMFRHQARRIGYVVDGSLPTSVT
jgi:hypothetical protein